MCAGPEKRGVGKRRSVKRKNLGLRTSFDEADDAEKPYLFRLSPNSKLRWQLKYRKNVFRVFSRPKPKG